MFSAAEMADDEMTLTTLGQFINVSSVSPRLSQINCDMIPLQFTGLKDKNDKDIYEGDIVQTKLAVKRKGVVEWGTSAGFVLRDENKIGTHFCVIDETTCEVIGNIYENPELLK